jgi:hypothetical protein
VFKLTALAGFLGTRYLGTVPSKKRVIRIEMTDIAETRYFLYPT